MKVQYFQPQLPGFTEKYFWSREDVEPIFDEIVEKIHTRIFNHGIEHYVFEVGGAFAKSAEMIRESNEEDASRGTLAWYHLLLQHLLEAFSSNSTADQRSALLDLAALTTRAIEDLDSRA